MVVTKKLSLETQGRSHILDLSAQVAEALRQSGVREGIVTVFVSGSTAGITVIEMEEGLMADFQAMWERLIPQRLGYRHDQKWGEANGHSHVRASLLGPSLTLPFAEQKLLVGTWQQVVLVDFDHRPRRREVVLQIMGDTPPKSAPSFGVRWA